MANTIDSSHELTLLALALREEKAIGRGFRRKLVGLVAAGGGKSELQAGVELISTGGWQAARQLMCAAERARVDIVTVFDEEYPDRLRTAPDPPLVLFVRGERRALVEDSTLAVVGTRSPTFYGRSVAEKLSREIASCGGLVVSGLAYGIDSAAHRGALEGARSTGGRAGIAVLGSGVCSVYPRENVRLAEEISAHGGAVLSEYGVECEPARHHFPERNRIISGVSRAVVVVEAGEKSGAVITAKLALEQGRDVFAVPGPITARQSHGTNRLIRDGAAPYLEFEDLAPYLPRKARVKNEPPPMVFNSEREERLVSSLRRTCAELGEPSLEQLAEQTNESISGVQTLLARLEVEGLVVALPGGRYGWREW